MSAPPVPLRTIAREWGRLGVVGFGGPPTHIVLLRRLCVDERRWIDATEFEDAIAVTNLLPGPASTQLAIWCAWRLRGARGALVGGIGFIAPGLALIVALSALFLSSSPPRWVLAAAAGAGASVPAVAVNAAAGLVPASWRRVRVDRAASLRWLAYVAIGALVAVLVGAYVVLAILAAGLVELARHRIDRHWSLPLAPIAVAPAGGLVAVAWVAFKVGALSYGGGFVIIPLMQHDAVTTYGWMTGQQFLNAVALGQVTPGPVVLTTAAVGYAAGGVGAALLAALVAFGPSFVFVIAGGRQLDRVRRSDSVRRFLTGAGAAAIGAIAGSAVTLARALQEWWQAGVLVGALAWLVVARRGVVSTLVLSGAAGVALVLLAGAPVAR